jgi:CRISPR/Cas system-associated exonuclease Cas4 (RecB family)
MTQIGYRGIYNKKTKAPFRVSRSKIELFKQCPRCFWLEATKGIKRPDSPPFNINKTIDELYKKEFDKYRAEKAPHPIMLEYKLEAIPFAHEQMDDWRHNFTGVQFEYKPANLVVFGAVDDVWVNPKEELIVVDYKATSKDREVTIDSDWQIAYKRQMEVYQWLLRQNGFTVSPTGYFVYTNGRSDLDAFNDHLEFRTKLISYTGDDQWIEQALKDMKMCLEQDNIPPVGTAAMGGPCNFCEYAKARTELTLDYLRTSQAKK